MPVTLIVKNVPDALADLLRARAKRNDRSLQEELLSILESVAGDRSPESASGRATDVRMSIVQLVARARRFFPQGTESSVAFIRAMRDGR